MYKISICFISFWSLFMLSLINFILGLFFLIFEKVIFIEWEIISLNSGMIVMSILLDWMVFFFMSFVMFISCVVLNYSYDYMEGDKNIIRFIMLVLMFIVSMILLIISPNLISILLGWDGLGLVSYCLVIYYQNLKSYNAGMLTILMNRVGDVAILLAIGWMLNYGSWNYIYYMDLLMNDMYMLFIGVMILLAGVTKSAQVPFSSWLPAAMAAPTPVSALVHSSTLVTAGVYLLIRFNYLIVSSFLGKFLLIISVLTMFMAGLIANFEYDLKKIIALSTLSQLGLMMSILSMGLIKLAFFHLLTHALFKALLFMCVGGIIHNFKGIQDIRYLGSLEKFMPITCISFNISNLALCGVPFLAGFYSKDLILEYLSMMEVNMLVYMLFYLSIGLTVCYTMRLSYYLVSNFINFYTLNSLMDESWGMLKSEVMLLMGVIMMGSILSWIIFPSPSMICLPLFMKMLVISMSLCGGFLGLELFKLEFNWGLFMLMKYKMSYYFGSMLFMYSIFTFGMNMKMFMVGYSVFKNFDQGWNEYLGGQGMFKSFIMKAKMFQFLQNNNMKIYLILIILWIILLLMLI
uniref:NADH-ubiquinone oxidoreductase chain 5 n=1 Tax=Rhyzodiastes puetzi TaxID=2983424 RepID=A0A977XT67_9CARA|nr:NADH dehydrogenase subunit 5 [Rhyzodiastes puetzi]UXW64219.1 NADH dehydrogenase subunit 5 [Rhyzodiastes puetzi]